MIMFRRFEIRITIHILRVRKNLCHSDHNTCSEINFQVPNKNLDLHIKFDYIKQVKKYEKQLFKSQFQC